MRALLATLRCGKGDVEGPTTLPRPGPGRPTTDRGSSPVLVTEAGGYFQLRCRLGAAEAEAVLPVRV